jgi:hypothetical protein
MVTLKDAQAMQLERQREQQSAPVTVAAYEPRSFEEAMRIALVYAQSGLLGEVRSQEAAVMIMATGAELGIPATTALRGIYIVKGKPVLSSDLIVALCLKRKDLCERFICVESTDTKATYETKRVGVTDAIRNSFSLEDAKRAKLGLEWDKGSGKLVSSTDSNWAKYPRAMLRHRAAAELARMVYPDIVLGLYTMAEEEELRRESIDVTPTPQLVTVPIQAEEGHTEATDDEPLADAMRRWKARLFTAANREECEAVRREAKPRVTKGSPEYAVIADLYATRVRELRDGLAPVTKPDATPPDESLNKIVEREFAVLESDVIDKLKTTFGSDVHVERDPGEDG